MRRSQPKSRDATNVEGAVRQAADRLDWEVNLPFGKVTSVIRESSTVSLGSIHRVSGSITITLPSVDSTDIGRALVLKNVGAAAAATVVAARGGTIDGTASDTLIAGTGSIYVVAGSNEWVEL